MAPLQKDLLNLLFGRRNRHQLAARIAEARPTSFRALDRIRGVGPMLLAVYGEDILALVRQHDHGKD